jgi:hypothetical protein
MVPKPSSFQFWKLKMPISDLFEAIFVHIPKNAGESIERCMGMYDGKVDETLWGVVANRIVLQHLTAAELKTKYVPQDKWDRYFKFAVVRNPWSKAVSEYNWYLRYGPTVPFYEWVKSLNGRLMANGCIAILEVGHNVEQHKYLYSNDQLLVDEVLKFESINQDFASLCKKFNWNVSLKHERETQSTSSLDFRQYYCDETAEIIGKIYKKDTELFGYSLDKTFADFEISSLPRELPDIFPAEL